MKENLRNTTNSRVYNLLLIDEYDLEDKWCRWYNWYWRNRPYRSWKYNRKTQYKMKKTYDAL